MSEIIVGMLFLGEIATLSCTMKEILSIEGVYYI